MKFNISNVISVPREDMPGIVKTQCEKRLCFVNPKWTDNEDHDRSQYRTERILRHMHLKTDSIQLPRGFIRQFLSILEYNNVSFSIQDNTRALPEVSFNFKGELYPFQQEAVKAVLSKRYGVLESPTGSGKTIIALYVIAQRRQPALVVVHTKELLYQWIDRATKFLDLDRDEIGIVGDGKSNIGEGLTIAIVNSLYKCADEVKDKIGFLICDEAHRCPSKTFSEAVSQFDSKFLLGLSATPYRRDKLTKLIYFYVGDRVFSIDPQTLQELNLIMTPELVVIETGCTYPYKGDEDYQPMIRAFTENASRNELIVNSVLMESKASQGIALVLSDRVEHCQTLFEMISSNGIETRLLTGSISNKKRKQTVEELNSGSISVMVSTSQLVSEGFDLPELSSVFLTTSVKYQGRIIQIVGRVLRVAEGKGTPRIFDFVDDVPVLEASFKSRCHAYRKLGVEIEGES